MVEPSKEALEAARDIISEWLDHDLTSWLDTELAELRDLIALALDRFRAEGVEAERERCVDAVAAEPELAGDPPDGVMAMLRTDPAEVMRIVCRITKREIIKRIRDQP